MKYQSIICNLQFENKIDISRDKDKIKDKNIGIFGKEIAVWFPLPKESIKSAQNCNDSLLSRSKANKSVCYFFLGTIRRIHDINVTRHHACSWFYQNSKRFWQVRELRDTLSNRRVSSKKTASFRYLLRFDRASPRRLSVPG